MKKLILSVLSFFILASTAFATLYTITLNGVSLVNPVIPNIWYVNASGSNLNTGLSQDQAWASINWQYVSPGDTIYMCGTFNSPITVSGSGNASYTITIDGNCSGNAGTIDGAAVVSGSWSSAGSNVYSISETTALKAVSYGIVTEDGTPLVGIGWKGTSAATITAMVAFGYGTWSYDATNKLLYVLTSAADSPAGHTIESSYGTATSAIITSSGHSYITIQNLTIQNAANYALSLKTGTNITVQNNTIKNTSAAAIFTSGLTNYVNTGNTITNQNWVAQSPISPSTWYASAAGAGSQTGVDQADAWAGIQWNSVTPGDTVYVCGTLHSAINIPIGGVSGHPTIIRGDCPGNAGIIDGANPVTSWSLVSSNVYSASLAVGSGPWACSGGPCGIVTEDDAALIDVPWNTNISTTIPTMVSTTATYSLGTWTYDATNGILYVFTTDASSPSGHTIEASYGQAFSELISSTSNSYLTIENLTAKNAADYGVYFNSGSNNIITNDTIYNIENWAVFAINGTTMTTNGNTLHHVVWQGHAPFPTNLGVGEGIRYYNTTGSIYSNTISYDPSIGIDLYQCPGFVNVYSNTIHDNIGMTTNYSGGIYSDNSQNNNIYGNLIYNYIVGISLNGEATSTYTSGTSVYNNIIYNWYYTGMYLGGGTSWTTSQNNFIYNNTIVSGSSGYTYNQAVAVQASVNDTFKNNIVFGNMYVYSNGSQTLGSGYFDYNQYLNSTFTGNVYTSFASWQGISEDSHGATSSPSIGSVFTSASGLNFELVAASAPIGAGVNLYSTFTTDYDGGTRQSSGPWDVGAYVYP